MDNQQIDWPAIWAYIEEYKRRRAAEEKAFLQWRRDNPRAVLDGFRRIIQQDKEQGKKHKLTISQY